MTGTDEKVALCVEDFGYEKAWNYKTADQGAVLSEAVPDGLDVYVDNVGGTILDEALRHLATHARVVQCGTASVSNWTPPPTGLRNEHEILTRRLHWSGFVLFDHLAEFDGIEHAAGSIADLYAGLNTASG